MRPARGKVAPLALIIVVVASMAIDSTSGTAVGNPTPPRDDCPGCRVEGGRTLLCGPHREKESEVLKAAAKSERSKDAPARISAYTSIAHLADAHANAP